VLIGISCLNRLSSVEFLKRVESSDIKAYTSALVIEEVIFKLTMQSASNLLDRVTLQGVKASLKNPQKRERVFGPVIRYREYIDTLRNFGMVVLDLTDKDLAEAVQLTNKYGLITADAAHLAVMIRRGIKHIASNDSDFKVVDNITLWMPDEK